MISREHKLRKGAYSVLIVCEGQNTEPSYFSKFQNYLNEKYKSEYPDGIYFSIFPYPQEEKEIIDLENQLFTRVKQKQEIQNFAAIINEDVEDEFLAEPTRWVRFAQKNSVNAGFNELWSVFDYDNRPVAEIKKAFDLARNTELENGNVKIAYSSYSFEYWLLLHYELFDTYIAGSECKDKNGKEIGCSRKGCTNSNNCNGTKCLGGYMRSKSYEVSNYNKTTESTFPALIPYLRKARYNASFIRQQPKNIKSSLWEIFPVTNMDLFIDSFVKDFLQIEWQFHGKKILLTPIEIIWNFDNNNFLNIKVSRTNKATVIFAIGKFKLLNSNFEEFVIEQRVQLSENDFMELKPIDTKQFNTEIKFISIEFDQKIYISLI